MTPIDAVVRRVVAEQGWRVGTTLENRVASRLHHFQVRPERDCIQQMRIGRFRVDFAFPAVQIVLEADGWYHLNPPAAARDAARDRWLRGQGWLVFRVNDEPDGDVFDEQIARVVHVVNVLSPYRRRWGRAS